MSDNTTAANLVRQNAGRESNPIFIYFGGSILFQKNIWSFLFRHIKNIEKPPLKQTGLKFNTMACVFQPVINTKK